MSTPTSSWDASLAGQWTYRSYRNDATVLVNADAPAGLVASFVAIKH